MPRSRSIALAALAATAALAGPSTAAAAPTVAAELPLTAQPGQLTVGPDGNVWVALDGITKDLARITPAGVVTEFDTTNVSTPIGITTGPDGNLWVTQSGGVARIAPATPTTATAFPVADISDPRGIVAGPDGNLWTGSGDKAIRITPAGVATSFTVAGMGARSIARGGDGRLWIADFGSQRVVAITTAGVPTLIPTGGGPQGIAAGVGTQMAFTNPGAVPQTIGRLSPGGAPATTNVPGTDPFGIAFGADGAYWTANFATSTLTRLTADGAASTLAGLTAGSGPRWITAGPGNTLWVSLETTKKVARITGVEPPAPPAPEPTPPAPPEPTPPSPTPPSADETGPEISRVRGTRKVRRGTPWVMRLTLDEPATLGVNWWSGRDVVAFKKIRAQAGVTRVRLGGWRLEPGRHKVTVVARDAAGNVTEITARRLTVLPRGKRAGRDRR